MRPAPAACIAALAVCLPLVLTAGETPAEKPPEAPAGNPAEKAARKAGPEGGRKVEVEPQLAHMVFFKLKENTPANRAKLMDGCRKYLTRHQGAIYFSVGERAEDMVRDVNDKDFDVALHLVFRTQANHDAYATHARHQQFIQECEGLWQSVRVFDSRIPMPPRVERDRKADPKAQQPALPDPAAGFAGMIRVKVIAKRDLGLVVSVEEVTKTWEHNKAPDAKSLVGKRVLVTIDRQGPQNVRLLNRYLGTLKPGDVTELDVAHKGGEELTLLELTAEQRKKVEESRKGE